MKSYNLAVENYKTVWLEGERWKDSRTACRKGGFVFRNQSVMTSFFWMGSVLFVIKIVKKVVCLVAEM